MEKSRFAVFGTGRYGPQIALSLAKRGAEVYTFDIKPTHAKRLKEDVALAITLDSTDKIAALRSVLVAGKLFLSIKKWKFVLNNK